MRRWRRASALATMATLALAGCGLHQGVDGDLVDDWAPLAAPAVFQPESDTCHPVAVKQASLTAHQPVDCDEEHQAETVYVGTLVEVPADQRTPPRPGAAARQAAYRECLREAKSALGTDHQNTRVGLYLVLPSDAGWRGGARWFRCDLVEYANIATSLVTERMGSLRGALTDASSPLALRCFNAVLTNKRVSSLNPVACTQSHNVEFVGTYQAPSGRYATVTRDEQKIHQACLEVVATYAKLPKDGNLRYRAGTIAFRPFQEEWEDGNRDMRCFLWTGDRKLTRSVEGGGTAVLPIQYR